MASGNKDINRSRRRFLETIVASTVAIGAGVIGYEIGKELIKCPPCPKCPQIPSNATTTTPTSGVSCSCPPCPAQSIPQGYDYIIFINNGNYYVMNSSGQTIYQSSDPGSAISYAINQLGSNGGRVLIRNGVYVCTSYPCVTINNTSSSGTPGLIIIEGEDPTGTIFTVGNGAVSSSGQGLFVISGSYMWLRRVGFNGNAGNNTYSVGNQFNIAVSSAKFVWIDSIYSTNGPGAVGVLNSSNVIVSNVVSEGDSIGVYVGGSDTVLIGYSSLRGSGNYGVEVSSSTNTVIYGSSIIDAGNGVLINDGDVLIDGGTITFPTVSGGYGVNATISTAGREVIISGTAITGSVANAINAAVNTQGTLAIQDSVVMAGSKSTLSVSSTPGNGAELVIIGASFRDQVTTAGSSPYNINGVDSVAIINSAFQFGNQTSSANGPSISNAKYLILRGNTIAGYSTGIGISSCSSAYLYDNYFAGVTTPVSYSNVSLMYAIRNIGWVPTVTTPSVPSSGSQVVNTYPVPVTVCLYGGSVSQITITKAGQSIIAFQSSTPQSINGECFLLDPGDSIAINYVQPPNWAWIPMT